MNNHGQKGTTVHKHLGTKEASRFLKLFILTKEDNVCQYIFRNPLNKKKVRSLGPKPQ